MPDSSAYAAVSCVGRRKLRGEGPAIPVLIRAGQIRARCRELHLGELVEMQATLDELPGNDLHSCLDADPSPHGSLG